MRLEDLQKSLKDMTQDEKLELIREIREDRRVSKVAITHKARQKKDKTDRLTDKFKGLSKDEQAELIKLLADQVGAEDNEGDAD